LRQSAAIAADIDAAQVQDPHLKSLDALNLVFDIGDR
jgi:hypothetical protein